MKNKNIHRLNVFVLKIHHQSQVIQRLCYVSPEDKISIVASIQ